jgi:deoxyadenosine/deoxycytidine kinase
VVIIAGRVGISETTLFEAQKMYRQEKLSPSKENEFVDKFSENYASWNEYKQKNFALKSPSVEKDECKHCKVHCPTI